MMAPTAIRAFWSPDFEFETTQTATTRRPKPEMRIAAPRHARPSTSRIIARQADPCPEHGGQHAEAHAFAGSK
jgi:hypothetical protein